MIPGIGSAIGTPTQTTPAIRGSAQVSTQQSGTTFSPTMPTHVAGDLLIVFVASNLGAGGFALTASGWTKKGEVQDAGGNHQATVFTKTATNSSTTITIANDNNARIAAVAYALQFASGTTSISTSATADPASLTTSWGFAATFWFVLCASGAAPIAAPTGFGDTVTASTTGIGMMTADKADGSATLDPDAFSASGGSPSITLAVQPL